MTSPPPNRCGYMWPQDHEQEDSPKQQSCCWRQTASEAEDRCPWHADSEGVTKSVERLAAARPPPDVRECNSPTNELLDGASLAGVNLGDTLSLANVSLRETDFSNADLRKANLVNTDLRQANLSDATLERANLSNAELKKTDLSNANLRKTKLSNANLYKADLSGANLFESDISHATLVNADLSDAILSQADISDTTSFFGAYLPGVDLRRADLSDRLLVNADLSNANLYKADLSETLLEDADLSGADLTEANLSEAILDGGDLSDAELPEADLSGATLEEADLSNAYGPDTDFSEANLDSCTLDNATLTGAILREAMLPSGDELSNANLSEADLEGQDLRDENLAGAQLSKTNLTDADLSGADLSEANLERALLNRTDLFDTCFAGARLDGTVFGDAQINEGTFKRLAPSTQREGDNRKLIERVAQLVLGPTGHDASRCVYDPKSQYDLLGSERETTVRPADEEGKLEADETEVRAGGVYRQFEQLAGDNALPDWQQRFFMLRQDMQTRQKTGRDYWFALVQRVLFGHGESFGRVIGWSGVIVVLFSLIYLAGGWIRPVEAGGDLGAPIVWTRLPGDLTVLWESLYYSTLTFTALGFGDFRPVNTVGQFLTIVETASGAILLALLVFVLGRRAAR